MKTKPLLSDDRLNRWANQYGYPTSKEIKRAMSFARDFYEAALAEDARLIQQLVDALKIHDEARAVMTPQDINLFRVKYDIQEGRVSDWLRERMDNALSAATARNFKPSQP